MRWRDVGGDFTNIQYKPICHCHNESPLYSKYILIFKIKKKETKGEEEEE
jgi:hypothetical protein